jgi:hypothetical protein
VTYLNNSGEGTEDLERRDGSSEGTKDLKRRDGSGEGMEGEDGGSGVGTLLLQSPARHTKCYIVI